MVAVLLPPLFEPPASLVVLSVVAVLARILFPLASSFSA